MDKQQIVEFQKKGREIYNNNGLTELKARGRETKVNYIDGKILKIISGHMADIATNFIIQKDTCTIDDFASEEYKKELYNLSQNISLSHSDIKGVMSDLIHKSEKYDQHRKSPKGDIQWDNKLLDGFNKTPRTQQDEIIQYFNGLVDSDTKKKVEYHYDLYKTLSAPEEKIILEQGDFDYYRDYIEKKIDAISDYERDLLHKITSDNFFKTKRQPVLQKLDHLEKQDNTIAMVALMQEMMEGEPLINEEKAYFSYILLYCSYRTRRVMKALIYFFLMKESITQTQHSSKKELLQKFVTEGVNRSVTHQAKNMLNDDDRNTLKNDDILRSQFVAEIAGKILRNEGLGDNITIGNKCFSVNRKDSSVKYLSENEYMQKHKNEINAIDNKGAENLINDPVFKKVIAWSFIVNDAEETNDEIFVYKKEMEDELSKTVNSRHTSLYQTTPHIFDLRHKFFCDYTWQAKPDGSFLYTTDIGHGLFAHDSVGFYIEKFAEPQKSTPTINKEQYGTMVILEDNIPQQEMWKTEVQNNYKVIKTVADMQDMEGYIQNTEIDNFLIDLQNFKNDMGGFEVIKKIIEYRKDNNINKKLHIHLFSLNRELLESIANLQERKKLQETALSYNITLTSENKRRFNINALLKDSPFQETKTKEQGSTGYFLSSIKKFFLIKK